MNRSRLIRSVVSFCFRWVDSTGHCDATSKCVSQCTQVPAQTQIQISQVESRLSIACCSACRLRTLSVWFCSQFAATVRESRMYASERLSDGKVRSTRIVSELSQRLRARFAGMFALQFDCVVEHNSAALLCQRRSKSTWEKHRFRFIRLNNRALICVRVLTLGGGSGGIVSVGLSVRCDRLVQIPRHR